MAVADGERSRVRVLPDDVANKIAAGEVVERPASVVKELVENALDAEATRITVRLVAAGTRLVDVQDNGCGMTEQDALLAVERHATSKIRDASDLDAIQTMGFRGEALASIASVSRFTLVTRLADEEWATRVVVDGGILRTVERTAASPGTRVSVERLYYNTPVRRKFLRSHATELGHCVDVVTRHALARPGVGFDLYHNDAMMFSVPASTDLLERVRILWGGAYAKDMVTVSGESGLWRVFGVVGLPGLSLSNRSRQYFYVNGRPVMHRALQYGLENAFRGLLTVGRYPVGVLLISVNPRLVDVNIHPTKREIRFRDDREPGEIIREIVRQALEQARRHRMVDMPALPDTGGESSEGGQQTAVISPRQDDAAASAAPDGPMMGGIGFPETPENVFVAADEISGGTATGSAGSEDSADSPPTGLVQPDAPSQVTEALQRADRPSFGGPFETACPPRKGDMSESAVSTIQTGEDSPGSLLETALGGLLTPEPLYEAVDRLPDISIQVFETYLILPLPDRLLIVDQHALHERINYERLKDQAEKGSSGVQQLMVPMLLEVTPAQSVLLEENAPLFERLGIVIEPFGAGVWQVSAVSPLYEESRVSDLMHQLLEELAQGRLFDQDRVLAEMLKLASRACKESIRAGTVLNAEERRDLLAGLRGLRPPYTCPHGRPIIVQITRKQLEKSFRRIL